MTFRNWLFLGIGVVSLGALMTQINMQSPVWGYCSSESKKYAIETRGGYYNPEAAYAAGKAIQDIVRSKDLEGLLALVDGELSNGPRKKFALSKSFDEVFPQEWVTSILEEEPSCDPVGWRGFMLGQGRLWYQVSGDDFNIGAINGAAQETLAPLGPWLYNGHPIHPQCFTRIWVSSDNFEEFERVYQIAANDCIVSYKLDDGSSIDICHSAVFREHPGLFLGSKITNFSPIRPSWCPEDSREPCATISIVNSLIQCNDSTDKLSTEGGVTKLINDLGVIDYQLISKVSTSNCDDLAPTIGENSSACYLVTIDENAGGSMGSSRDIGIYGIFDLPKLGESLVPLVFFTSLNEALNYIDSLEQ